MITSSPFAMGLERLGLCREGLDMRSDHVHTRHNEYLKTTISMEVSNTVWELNERQLYQYPLLG